MMLKIDGFKSSDGPLRVLCLGAHCDDLEIGCGGTIMRLLESYPDATVRWVVFATKGPRAQEARSAAEAFLAGAGQPVITLEEFRDGFFPYEGYDVKEHFEKLKSQMDPHVVFTHYRDDLHQDHRLINELTWNTFRDHFVLEYEIPKYDGDMGVPNYFVHLSEARATRKVDLIWEHFVSQRDKHWLTKENLLALMRLRGIECRAPDGFAEAFYCRKILW